MDEPRVIVLDRRRRTLALAAAIAVTVGAAMVWRAVDRTVESPAQVVATAAGERRDLTLPDGSRIELAPGSSVEVAGGYGNPERRVVLEGEAWFDVRHDPARPFRVHAAGTVTEDLGTTFSIRARDGSPVRVVLVTGKASFRRAGAAAVLELDPGDVGVLGPADSTPVATRQIGISDLVSWREGRLDFRDALIGEVLAELGRWYAIDFQLADSALAARRITHTFMAGDLDDALEVLSLSLGVRAERAGAVVTLR
jgi:transmembrane sensor